MNWRRVLAIMRKEWWHITRDRASFSLLMLSPVLVLVTMGYAFSVDIKDVKIGVLDQDLSQLSATSRQAEPVRCRWWWMALTPARRATPSGTLGRTRSISLPNNSGTGWNG